MMLAIILPRTRWADEKEGNKKKNKKSKL